MCPSCQQPDGAERCMCCVYRQLGKRAGSDGHTGPAQEQTGLGQVYLRTSPMSAALRESAMPDGLREYPLPAGLREFLMAAGLRESPMPSILRKFPTPVAKSDRLSLNTGYRPAVLQSKPIGLTQNQLQEKLLQVEKLAEIFQ
ncbi:hypothetical protein ElyMa_003648200 [Elysia marginata]|uniref:Uncharacterized protein n=1 Tax=Elysia marginata TaxID=1093978 RepID=A0AAV4EVC3_9GAST|nr:hypothetical protein ElyMa_003648200 [Elysia marginata]